MRRNISLYIGDHLVDLDDQSFILFNYTMEDLSNPTIVKNSFSQQITIKGTPNNNKIFGDIFRLDRYNTSVVSGYGVGFNPSKKTSFTIYNEMSEVLECGYVKLDSIERTGRQIQYKVTLYGGLGTFLSGLTYRSDGNKMSLADLDFLGTGDPDSELTYSIDRFLVANAWSVLAGEVQNELFEVINFCPAYEGVPEDFDADKVIFDASVYGMSGQLIANLSRDYTGMEAHDLRSYLLRPVIRWKKVMEAIADPDNNGGYMVKFSDGITTGNYWENVWMTLPILNGKHSGDTMTKADLLGSTDTPANYLLSYVKMFGLKILINEKTKVVEIMTRGEFHNGTIIDISNRIDKSQVQPITPVMMESKWLKMSSPDEGEYASNYQKAYNKEYGCQRINTGYEFNLDEKTITDGIVFRGGVQVKESSDVFLDASFGVENVPIPAPFVNGGSYTIINEGGETNEYQLRAGIISVSYWDTTNKGRDICDYVQLHKEENGALDGSNVLLFYTGMVPQPHLRLTDDVTGFDTHCWNYSSVNTRVLFDIPHFSRFIINDNSLISHTLDWGENAELYVDNAYLNDRIGLYHEFWRNYMSDRMDDDTIMVRMKVNLSGMFVGFDLMRNFYWFDNSVWSLNRIINHSITTWDDTECEFIRVMDINNYRA